MEGSYMVESREQIPNSDVKLTATPRTGKGGWMDLGPLARSLAFILWTVHSISWPCSVG